MASTTQIPLDAHDAVTIAIETYEAAANQDRSAGPNSSLDQKTRAETIATGKRRWVILATAAILLIIVVAVGVSASMSNNNNKSSESTLAPVGPSTPSPTDPLKTTSPTESPSSVPSLLPSSFPTSAPTTLSPTKFPTVPPTAFPTSSPTSVFLSETVLNAEDESGYGFGASVDVSGNTAIVGAWGYDNADDAHPARTRGAAFIFIWDGIDWYLQDRIKAVGAKQHHKFGTSVAISGNTAVVGAVGDDGEHAAYVFQRNGSSWSQQAKITALDAGDTFGQTVAIDGTTIVVGDSETSSAYVFVRNGTTWTRQDKLTRGNGPASGWFNVAISGDIVVVGRPFESRGSVYVFERVGASWNKQSQITADNDSDNPYDFGISVAIDGDTIVLGASYYSYWRGLWLGLVYVYVTDGVAWHQQDKIKAHQQDFGRSVAISGNTILVGAPRSGSAFLFGRNDDMTWLEKAEILARDTNEIEIGWSVAIDGDSAIIGGDGYGSTSAYAYKLN